MLKLQVIAFIFFLGGVTSRMIGAVTHEALPASPNGLVFVLTALFAGGVSTALVNLYKQKKMGKAQGDQLLASAMNEAISAANIMLIAYRKDLEEAVRVKTELTDILVKRNETISRLEKELGQCTNEKAAIKREFETSITEVAKVKEELDEYREREENLTIKIRTLEGITQGGNHE